MKIKKTLLIIPFLLFFLEMGCDKKETETATEKVVFYTNAQATLNCGPFNVTVYVDSNEVGFISEPFISENLPDTINTTSTLVLGKAEGRYSYTAKMNCGQSGIWTGDFEVRKGKIVYIFLDVKDCVSK